MHKNYYLSHTHIGRKEMIRGSNFIAIQPIMNTFEQLRTQQYWPLKLQLILKSWLLWKYREKAIGNKTEQEGQDGPVLLNWVPVSSQLAFRFKRRSSK